MDTGGRQLDRTCRDCPSPGQTHHARRQHRSTLLERVVVQAEGPARSDEARTCRPPSPPTPTTLRVCASARRESDATDQNAGELIPTQRENRLSFRFSSAVLHAASRRQPTIPDDSRQFMQACRKDTTASNDRRSLLRTGVVAQSIQPGGSRASIAVTPSLASWTSCDLHWFGIECGWPPPSAHHGRSNEGLHTQITTVRLRKPYHAQNA